MTKYGRYIRPRDIEVVKKFLLTIVILNLIKTKDVEVFRTLETHNIWSD